MQKYLPVVHFAKGTCRLDVPPGHRAVRGGLGDGDAGVWAAVVDADDVVVRIAKQRRGRPAGDTDEWAAADAPPDLLEAATKLVSEGRFAPLHTGAFGGAGRPYRTNC